MTKPELTKRAVNHKAPGYIAGFAYGRASSNVLADAVHAVAALLDGGKLLTLASYTKLRGDWIVGYTMGMGCKETSSEKRWAEVWQGVESAYGFKKPQSAEALKKAMQRSKAKLSQGAGKAETPTATGTASAQVSEALTAIGAAMSAATRGPDYSLPVQGETQPAPQAPTTGTQAAAETLSALDRHLLAIFHSAQKSGDFTKLMDFVRSLAMGDKKNSGAATEAPF